MKEERVDRVLRHIAKVLQTHLTDSESFSERLLQAAIVNFGHLVNTEDYEICQAAQKGMRSGVYRQGRYAAQQEMCLHHFHQLLTTHMQPHLAAWEAEHGGTV